jgi:hypothetical protein
MGQAGLPPNAMRLPMIARPLEPCHGEGATTRWPRTCPIRRPSRKGRLPRRAWRVFRTYCNRRLRLRNTRDGRSAGRSPRSCGRMGLHEASTRPLHGRPRVSTPRPRRGGADRTTRRRTVSMRDASPRAKTGSDSTKGRWPSEPPYHQRRPARDHPRTQREVGE